MSATTDRVGELVTPILERRGLDLYDIDQPGGSLRVMVDRPGGVGVDELAEVSRELSARLDESEPVAGSYTLEVSSPGLERPLRTRSHFEGAIGDRVKLKLYPGGEGDRRIDGTLSELDGETVTVITTDGVRSAELSRIAKAHTVFEWDGGSRETTETTTESKEENR